MVTSFSSRSASLSTQGTASVSAGMRKPMVPTVNQSGGIIWQLVDLRRLMASQSGTSILRAGRIGPTGSCRTG